MTKKRVRFHENEFIYLPTYSREEYDRKSSMETFTFLATQAKKRKFEQEKVDHGSLQRTEGSWADAFLSMGSSDIDIWVT